MTRYFYINFKIIKVCILIISVVFLGLKCLASMKFIIYLLNCTIKIINSYFLSLVQQYSGDDALSELEKVS